MVKLPDVQAANARFVKRKSLVVLSAGGTSGIGETTLRQLCTVAGQEASQGAGLHIYLIARNKQTAEKLLADYKGLSPKADFTFIYAKDLSLLKDVDNASKEVTDLLRERDGPAARIDLLIMSQAIFDPWLGRKDTAEGLDLNMSLLYYSRMRLIHQLLPLLTAHSSPELPAHIISVYAGGMESKGKFHADDLSLRFNYSFSDARTNVIYMKTMFFEHLANDYPGKLSLVHVYPGLVITPAFKAGIKTPSYPLWFRVLARGLTPIAQLTIATPVIESGQRTLFLASDRYPSQPTVDSKAQATTTTHGLPIAVASDGKLGGGAYSCAVSGETSKGLEKAYAKLRKEGFYDRVWTHTMDAFNTIESGQLFSR